MRIVFFFLIAAAAGSAIFEPTEAQESGDPKKGLAYAENTCTECHAVLAEEELSPVLGAPTFSAVANTPGMTERALTVFFQTPHPTMPNLVISEEDRANVIAYIMSLKKPHRASGTE